MDKVDVDEVRVAVTCGCFCCLLVVDLGNCHMRTKPRVIITISFKESVE